MNLTVWTLSEPRSLSSETYELLCAVTRAKLAAEGQQLPLDHGLLAC